MKENKQTIEASIVMLPTDKASQLYIMTKSKELMSWHIPISPLKENGTSQHLYFTSTEEIKEGDWCYVTLKPGICQYKIGMGLEWLKKIVATTDPELWYKDIDNKCIHCGFVKEQPYGICSSCARFQNQNYQQLVPKIPTSFLEPFITAYNAGKPIAQVLLETEKVLDEENNKEMSWVNEIKLRNDGSVIIHPVVEKTYTKEEVKEIAVKYGYFISMDFDPIVHIDEWFDNYSNRSI